MNTTKPQTVLMTADTVGGVWTYALELAREFDQRGINVALATMGRRVTVDQAAAASRISNLQLFESEFKLEWMDDPWVDVDSAGDWLLSLEDLLDPDIVHLNGYAHGDLPWSSPTAVVAHSCVASWWQAVKRESLPPDWKTYRERVTRGLAAADRIVAPTFAMLDALQENYGPFERSGVIPNGRQADGFRSGPKEKLVFAAGRLWDEAKNVASLDSIASSLDWPVYIAGDQTLSNGTVPSSSVFPNSHLLGRLSMDEVSEWYSRAAIYALPARYEPFGLTILEAALSGCALVLGDIPSLRELWHDSAVFVSPDDEEELRAAITGLVDDPSSRREFAERARARALDYSSEKTADGYLELYSELMSKHMIHTPVREGAACV